MNHNFAFVSIYETAMGLLNLDYFIISPELVCKSFYLFAVLLLKAELLFCFQVKHHASCIEPSIPSEFRRIFKLVEC